ncbi:MAG: phosphotransferase [Eubacteriales bacterium]|nr:phosphotransferase [Eubacteriales bacterium]
MEKFLIEIAKQFYNYVISVEFLTKCKNSIYKVRCSDFSFILRLTEESHRNLKQIESELDFQKYLYNNGADVAKPLQTKLGKSCIIIEIDKLSYIVSAFEFVTGKDWNERVDNTEETFIIIGKALGKIHRLSKGYNPGNIEKRRLWSEQQELQKAGSIFRNHNTMLFNKFTEFMQLMEKEEKRGDNFGLTHGDYLVSNYLIDDHNNIKVIDFDDCEYSWYAADIAICMRCYLFWTEHPDELPMKSNEAEIMHYGLLYGYNFENKITKEMVFDLDKYFKIRDFIELAQLIIQDQLNDIEKILYDMCLDRIVNEKPFLDFNTEQAQKLLYKNE